MKQLAHHIISALIGIVCVFSSQAQSLVEKAEKAYSEDKFNEALSLYEEAAQTEGVSTDLYYNIGNCYYRLGNNGKAILYYERALNLDPANSNARDNLEFVKNRITDDINVDETNIIGEFINSVMNSMSSNGWAILSIVLFILLITAVALYIFSNTVIIRKIGFFGGIILLILTIFTNCLAFKSYKKIAEHRYAVITIPSVTLSTSPRTPKDKTEEAFILNQGTKIYILDSVVTKSANSNDVWYDIKADDTHRAWINKSAIDII